ncbi:hypothetical protein Egran_05749 [Elaphomyces granulatus]|uniref:Argonaute complex, subunit Arb1 n=1 Tax=Elaphomyces granulatus TaxID=519963 RepID=A0A232LQN7_9EURO|nr:hypothetical protein Egran_05749 [Elaphomyces granulatus]
METPDNMSDSQAAPTLQADHESCEAPHVTNDAESNLLNTTPENKLDGVRELDNQMVINMVKQTKKKRSRKPKSKRGQNKPTGFEEYYVDAPMTPEEYKQETTIYKLSRPVIYRIDDAITRFQANRRLEMDRMQVFTKYLAYGGIDVGPKVFGGLDNHDLEDLDKEQILLARSQTTIVEERSKLKIDFDTVAKGYLTSYFPEYFNPDTEDMVRLAPVTIKNFLNYLLYHDVCPEYKENINAARISCDIAAKELLKNQQFIATGPGDFNKACSTLFGGYFYDLHVEDYIEDGKDPSVQMPNNVARKVVRFAIAGAGSDEQATRFLSFVNNHELNAAKIEDIDGFEITNIVLPDDELREFYRSEAADLNIVGKLYGKSYRDPAKPEIDMSPAERKEWEDGGAPSYEFEFLLEESLLRLCYPGMKVITSVWELNCGLYFFDEVFNAYCSIYTALANDIMLGWKNPRTISATDPPESEEIGDVDT